MLLGIPRLPLLTPYTISGRALRRLRDWMKTPRKMSRELEHIKALTQLSKYTA